MTASDITGITAADIASRDIVYIDKDSATGDAVTELRNRELHNLLVCSGKRYIGVFGYKQLFRLYGKNMQKTVIKPYISRPPLIAPETTIPKIADYMYRLDSKIIPVGNAENVIGIVSESDIMDKALRSGMFRDIKAGDIMSPKPITMRHDETLGKALQLMRENDISRLPVLDTDEKLAGIVESKDIVKKILLEKESYGELIEISPSQRGSTVEGEAYAPSEVSDRDVKISALMKTEMIVGGPEDSVESFFAPRDTGQVSTVLIEEDGRLIGIISPKDIVRHISALAEKKRMLVWISGIDDLGLYDFDIRELYRMIGETASKLSKKTEINAFSVHAKKYKDSGKRMKYSLRCRLSTAKQIFVAGHDGWDIRDVFGQLMDKIERLVIQSWDKKRGDMQDSRRKYVYFEGVD